MEYPILDGFSYRSQLRCDLQFQALAVREYEALRRSAGYRQKQWGIPQDSQAIVIPARDSYYFQQYMRPGAAIWGYAISGVTDTEDGTLAIQIRNACNDQKVFSEHNTRRFSAGTPYPQQYFSRLLIVGAPGLLNVEITSTFAADVHAQLVLFGGEPAYGV